jgi:ABC-type amino acid transport system permease subunit
MPRHLLFAFLLYIASRGTMAVLAPMYETGVARITSPILMLLFIAVSVLFMRRSPWTWKLMQAIAFTEIALNGLFFPSPKYHGAYTGVAQLLIAAVMTSSCVILWSLIRGPATKSWFSHRDA